MHTPNDLSATSRRHKKRCDLEVTVPTSSNPSLILGSSSVRLSRAWKELLRLIMNESLTSHNALAAHELLKTRLSPNKGPTAVLGKVWYLPPALRGQDSVLILTCREQRRKDAQKGGISAFLNSFLFLVLMICGCSAAQSCLTLCNPMDCSTPGLPVLHHRPRACSNSCPLSR